jgi:hypothetical protein
VSLIEICISAFLMVAIAAFGLDLTLIMIGLSICDTACRDAARAAAQQSTSAKAIQAAQSQLQVHSTDGYWITQPTLVSTASPNFVYNDYGGNPPTNVSPYVTVTTTASVRCPAPIFFFGASFVKGGMIQFTRSYTFPIIKETFYG